MCTFALWKKPTNEQSNRAPSVRQDIALPLAKFLN